MQGAHTGRLEAINLCTKQPSKFIAIASRQLDLRILLIVTQLHDASNGIYRRTFIFPGPSRQAALVSVEMQNAFEACWGRPISGKVWKPSILPRLRA